MTPSDTERLAREAGIDWHAHGMAWALADSMGGDVDDDSEWTADDVARAFKAGALAALELAAKDCDVIACVLMHKSDPEREAVADECAAAVRAMKGRE